jgi:4-hydroxy-3-methylbut-2-en-1-yl diphosphate reductase
MKIIRAEHLGMCFGVRDAIALAINESAAAPFTILGELVHNETVINDLGARGVTIRGEVADVTTPRVMITAHGASQRILNQARGRGLSVIEATCPLVHAAHRALTELVREGFHPVVIGRRDHVEVRGLTGDLAEFDVVLDEADLQTLHERPRLGIIAQTTQPVARAERLVDLIRRRFPASELRFVDTVCRPTKQNQSAAVELAQRSDVVIVIGGAHSNNTLELANTCRRHCARVHHVQGAADLRAEWFCSDDTVGLTAGTSTPDDVIDEVERRLDPNAVTSSGTIQSRLAKKFAKNPDIFE